MSLIEAQIDRIVGPTHHFGGLGVGNVASQMHGGQESNPAAAALQGLDKMRRVFDLGVPQLLLPPMPRPDWTFLRSIGFSGSDAEVLSQAAEESPHMLSAAMSCSAMWTANAATVTPTADSPVERPTLTVANLSSSPHRSIEPSQAMRELETLLLPVCHVRPPILGGAAMRDEGAANHMRFANRDGNGGLHVFVYGDESPMPMLHWPRQTLASVEAIARGHRLPDTKVFFLKQNPAAIDAG
ncbi:MAG: N-succinylarginine dihydrolase, partial [Rubripirellula sp.]